ncbi:hypothetical protein [Bacillus paramycoides]|uniref:hypothetical protein n=1 Tax=Bacillus paramycoides TaxID=2026194 RepID=UPI0037FEF999
MKTTNKLELMLDIIEKADKKALLNFVRGMSESDMTHMAKIVPAIRSSIKYEYAEQPKMTVQTIDGKKVYRIDIGATPAIKLPIARIKKNENKELKELKEINEKYAKRAETPKSEFIKCTNHEQLFDLIMKDKKEKGWKFKNES